MRSSKEETIKLNNLSILVAYHLEVDDRQAMTMDQDRQTLIPNMKTETNSTMHPEVDCIVIYSTFLSSNNA